MATAGNGQLDHDGAKERELTRLRIFGAVLLAALATICLRLAEIHWADATALVRRVTGEHAPPQEARPSAPVETADLRKPAQPAQSAPDSANQHPADTGGGKPQPNPAAAPASSANDDPMAPTPPDPQQQKEPSRPKRTHEPVPAPPEESPPSAVPAAPEAPPRQEFHGVKLRNDSASSATVHFLMDGKVVTLAPGNEQAFSGDGPWTIGFHRGGDFGAARYRLTPGEFAFRATAQGWGLFRIPKARP